jgi:hypothetical protein
VEIAQQLQVDTRVGRRAFRKSFVAPGIKRGVTMRRRTKLKRAVYIGVVQWEPMLQAIPMHAVDRGRPGSDKRFA